MLTAFCRGDDSMGAFKALRAALLDNGPQFKHRVGFRGDNVDETITWHSKVHMWSLLKMNKGSKRFWCGFGVQNPKDVESLDIAVEVNPRLEGTDLQVGGAFTKDARGVVHLCHNGKIGGGKPGVGKTAFFDHYRGEIMEMSYNGRLVDVADLGPIDSRRLPERIAWFTREVVRIKRVIETESGSSDDSQPRSGVAVAKEIPGFVPEFSGVRQQYGVRGDIEAKVDHGPVVYALAASLDSLGYVPHNDRARDLFTLDKDNRVEVLFEVKTDITTTSIYTAVGQLLLNGGAGNDGLKMILVVPGIPKRKTRQVLSTIGIGVLAYKWSRGKPVISTSALRRLMR